ncbi:hypothetical protein, partial [Nostoc sp. UIC 10630]|uniref:hypothetical protein n=1 Tax=Nostoc sp. UIC 10630 TaxID=2100146 RepID=UPI001A9CA2D5
PLKEIRSLSLAFYIIATKCQLVQTQVKNDIISIASPAEAAVIISAPSNSNKKVSKVLVSGSSSTTSNRRPLKDID